MQIELVDEASGLAYGAVALSVLGDHRFEALVDSVSSELVEAEQPVINRAAYRPVPHLDAQMLEAFRFF
ncbi:MAG: hypothetical protein R2733_17475 [Acidimicrobiales bacterium]